MPVNIVLNTDQLRRLIRREPVDVGFVVTMEPKRLNVSLGDVDYEALVESLREAMVMLDRSAECQRGIALANRLLDEPMADPDDDLRLLSRQFLRMVENVDRLNDVCCRVMG